MSMIDRIMPLTVRQAEVFLEQRLAPHSSRCNVAGSWRIEGAIDEQLLQEAFVHLVAATDTLRLVLREGKAAPGQQILPSSAAVLRCVELADEAAAHAWMATDAQRTFCLFDEPLHRFALLRVSSQLRFLYSVTHHTLADGWSHNLCIERLCDAYNALAAGQTPHREYPSVLELLGAEHDYIASADARRNRDFWLRRLADLPLPPMRPLPSKNAADATCAESAATVSFEFSQEVYAALGERAAVVRAKAYHGLLAAIYGFFGYLGNADDIVLGLASLNRPTRSLRKIVGMLVSVTPLRVCGGLRESWERITQQVAAQLREVQAGRHERYPLSMVARDLRLLESGRERLCDINVSNVLSTERMRLGGAIVHPTVGLLNGQPRGPLYIQLLAMDKTRPVRADFICSTAYFDRAALDRVREFREYVEHFIRAPGEPVGRVPLSFARHGHTGTRLPPAAQTCIHELFEAQVDRVPGAVAVMVNGESITYRELDARANQLARHLSGIGVGPESIVALYLERSLDMVVAVLAVWKAGGAYLPLDLDSPPERLARVVDGSRAVIVVTHGNMARRMPEGLARLVRLDLEAAVIAAQPDTRPAYKAHADNLAYVIYTSGSSGEPKGVLLSHRGLCNLAEVQLSHFNLGPADRVLQFARLNFDAATWEMVMAFRAGAALCLAAAFELMPGYALARTLIGAGVTAATLPPSALPLLMKYDFPDLKTLIVAGESCPQATSDHWAGRCRMINAYGPTETTVCASFGDCCAGRPVSIGWPVERARLYLLDERLREAPAGVAGEIYVAGVCLARGYAGRPGLTAERFVANPFDPSGARLYRTGDRARLLPDGTLGFLGRVDRQIKMRGYRIEPEEIEAVLRRFAGIEHAAVVSHGERENMRLLAYVVESTGASQSDESLRAHLRERLPEFMVPNAFVRVVALPLTPNGKTDYRALSVPPPATPGQEGASPPRAVLSPLETELATIWSEVLRVDRIGPDDNFFDCGGNSLLLARAVEVINQRLGVALAPIDALRYTTVAMLARGIRARA